MRDSKTIHNALTFNHPEDTQVNLDDFLQNNQPKQVQDDNEDAFLNDIEEGILNATSYNA